MLNIAVIMSIRNASSMRRTVNGVHMMLFACPKMIGHRSVLTILMDQFKTDGRRLLTKFWQRLKMLSNIKSYSFSD